MTEITLTVTGNQGSGKTFLADWLAVQMQRRCMNVTVDGEPANDPVITKPFLGQLGKKLHGKTVHIVTSNGKSCD